MLQQMISGLEAGSAYSLLGISIVMIMRSTDVPNFAMAEMGLVAAYFAFGLTTWSVWNMPFLLVVVVALLFAAALGASIQILLIRPLTGLSAGPLAVAGGLITVYVVTRAFDTGGMPFVDSAGWPLIPSLIVGVVAGIAVSLFLRRLVRPLPRVDHFPLLLLTIGLLLVLGTSIHLLWGSAPKRLAAPWSNKTFKLAGQFVGWDQIVTIAVGLAVALGLSAFFRSKWGVRMRAVAEDAVTSRLLGIQSGRISLVAWAIGTVIAAIALILSTSSTILNLGSGDSLILKGFIAAVLGGFTSLLGAFWGGLIVGVAEALAGRYVGTAVQSTVALLVVVVVLLAVPGGLTRQAKPREV